MKLNGLDLNKLQVFLVVSQSASMTEAAATLMRTPSAVSQCIASLEKSLEAQLFRRVGSRIFLTDEGRTLSLGLARYQGDLEQLLSRLSVRQKEISGEVRLGLLPGFSPDSIGSPLAKFMVDYPAARLRIKFENHAELAFALAQNRLDLALSLVPLDGLNRNLKSERLFEEKLVLVSGARARLPSPARENIEALPIIEYHQSPSLYKQWVRHHYGFTPRTVNVRSYAATLDYVLELVQRGVGFSVVPLHIIETRRLNRRLAMHQGTRGGALSSPVWMNSAKSVYLNAASERLRQALKDSL